MSVAAKPLRGRSYDRGRWKPARNGRVRCPECRRTIAITNQGLLRCHGGLGGADVCPTGALPVEAVTAR
jgi:succinate dehydrogenase/fumarate reductase-like Fe-S protein